MKEDEMKIVIKAKEKMMAKIKARSKMSPFLIQSVKSSSKAFFCFYQFIFVIMLLFISINQLMKKILIE